MERNFLSKKTKVMNIIQVFVLKYYLKFSKVKNNTNNLINNYQKMRLMFSNNNNNNLKNYIHFSRFLKNIQLIKTDLTKE